MIRIVIAISLLSFNGLFAQITQTLRGSVYDAYTEVPLGGVEVRLEGTTKSTLSDGLGAFRFDSVEIGRYDVAFERGRL
jgi:hypothetical protein